MRLAAGVPLRHNRAMMRTPDGWTVEVIDVEGRRWYRVKHHGSLVGGEMGRRRGLYRTVDEVEQLMGDSFAKLATAP